MNFSFSDEQKLLRDSVRRFIENDYGFDARRKIVASEAGFSRQNWQTFAELGWLGLPFSEDDGGVGGGPVETMILLEEFGKGLVVEPYLASVVLGGGAIAMAGSDEQKQALLAPLIDGSLQLALAYAEPQSRFDLANVATSATRRGEQYRLNGHKAVVLNGAAADKLIVSARAGDDFLLFIVDTQAAGVDKRPYPTVDGQRAADFIFNDVAAEALGDSHHGAGLVLLETLIDSATVALCGEAAGIMQSMVNMTVEYCKTREQFGQPIGNFQVLQHRMVDMFIDYELSRSLLYMAVLKLAAPQSERQQAVSALKVRVGQAGRAIGQQAIQLHGGMGMTDELAIGHYFKRLTMIDTLFGNVDFHLRRFSRLSVHSVHTEGV